MEKKLWFLHEKQGFWGKCVPKEALGTRKQEKEKRREEKRREKRAGK